MSWRIGVDIGGTFTDVVLVDEARGGIGVLKVPTTPRDFARGVLDALAAATESRGIAPADVTWLAHATTVVTNALLEGKGARTALITTRGMRDVLELRRSARASLYDLFQDAPAVLVPRHLPSRDHRARGRAGRGGGAAPARGAGRRRRLHQAP